MGKIFKAYKNSYLIKSGFDEAFNDCVKDLLATEEVLSLSRYSQHLDINRLQHVISVSYLSYLACRKFGLDYSAAARGAVLHDLFYYDWRVKDDNSHRLHGYRHPAFALKNAKALTTLSKKEENIILRHMWPLTPTPPRFRESFIVCMSDKYCATIEIVYSFCVRNKIKFLDFEFEIG